MTFSVASSDSHIVQTPEFWWCRTPSGPSAAGEIRHSSRNLVSSFTDVHHNLVSISQHPFLIFCPLLSTAFVNPAIGQWRSFHSSPLVERTAILTLSFGTTDPLLYSRPRF